jgi:hypothetical protein
MENHTQGKVSTYLVIALVSIAVIMGTGAYYAGESVADGINPSPAYPNTAQSYIGQNFFTNLNGFVANVNDLGTALQQITPDISNQNPQFFIDTSLAGVAILKIILGIPILIVTFIYDLVRIMLFFLPAQPSLLFISMVAILVMLPILYIAMEVASAIRPPGIAKW